MTQPVVIWYLVLLLNNGSVIPMQSLEACMKSGDAVAFHFQCVNNVTGEVKGK